MTKMFVESDDRAGCKQTLILHENCVEFHRIVGISWGHFTRVLHVAAWPWALVRHIYCDYITLFDAHIKPLCLILKNKQEGVMAGRTVCIMLFFHGFFSIDRQVLGQKTVTIASYNIWNVMFQWDTRKQFIAEMVIA